MTVKPLLARLARGLLVGVGLSVFAVGLFVVFVPGVDAYLPMEALIEALGSDYVVVAALGIAAIGFALFAALFRRLTGVDEAVTPIVEGIQSAPSPGASFDRSTGRLFGLWISGSTRDRLREAAIRTLMRSESCSRSAAERRVEAGLWTDDAVAASLLEGTDSDGRFGFGSRIERTVDAIEAVGSGKARSTAGGHSEGSPSRDERRVRDDATGSALGTGDGRTERGRGTAPMRGN